MKLPRLDTQTIDRLVTLAAFLFAAVTLWLLSGCNGQIGRSGGPKKQSFVVVMHNDDIGYPASMSVTWWRGSTIAGTSWTDIPSGGEAAFAMGDAPDGFMVEVIGWSSVPNSGLSFGMPDYRDGKVFHVRYPSGTTWSQYAPR